MTERFKHSEIIQDDGQTICYGIEDTRTRHIFNVIGDGVYDISEKKLIKLLNELNDENEQLKEFKEDFIKMLDAITSAYVNLLNESWEENEQLQQRNDRQAKQLDRLYHLVEEKDWRALFDIIDDFKRCEEQLQKEWGTYGDVE